MIELPDYVPVVFIFTTLATVLLFYFTITKGNIDHGRSKARFIIGLHLVWLVIQASLAMNGFYENTSGFPPRIMLALVIPLLVIVSLFIMQEGKTFMDGMSIKHLTYIHVVR